jgi:hypothetical protein
MPSVQLTKEEFSKRFHERFYDPTFGAVAPEIEKSHCRGVENYIEYHRNPRKRRAGAGFSDPDFPLSIEWLEAQRALQQAEKRHKSPESNAPDGGNPDPTLTGGKNPQRAKEVELKGWHYPRHLAGRVFSVVVHGDAIGAETLRRSLTDWLTDMGLIAAGRAALVDGYVGYYKPYATSHDELDQNKNFQEEVRNAARSLTRAVRLLRRGKLKQPDASLREPRPK